MQPQLKTTSSIPCAAMGRGRILFILFLLLGIGVGFGQTIVIDDGDGVNTSETGTFDTFTVVLDTQPTTDVVLEVVSGNTDEGTVDVSTLTFTNTDWNIPQTVTVTGIDDAVIDGIQTYDITVSVDATNSDNAFDLLAPQTVSVENADDDIAGFNIVESGGSTETSETGTFDTFTVVLDAQPTTDVVFDIVSGNTGEGTVDVSTLTFTNTDWNIPQTVTVTGIDDAVIDGIQTYDITVSVDATNSDDAFDLLAPQTVSVENADDDIAGFNIVESGGSTETSETGTFDTFTVVLDAQPTTDVVFDIVSGNTGEGTVDVSTLTFTNTDWNIPQTVTVTGIDDAVIDGIQTYDITVSVDATNSDDAFDLLASQTVSVDNADNDSAIATITATDDTASELGTEEGVFTVDIGRVNETGAPIIVSYTVTGSSTATPDDDYDALSGSVNVADGQQTAVIVVDPIDDSLTELDETVVVSLANGTGYTIGTPSSATVTITSDDNIPPDGYTVTIDQDPIDLANEENVSFSFSGAPTLLTTFDYAFTSDGDGNTETVSGNGSVLFVNRTVSNIDLSSLPDGLITLTVTISNILGNQGPETTDTAIKDTSVPSGYTVSIDQDMIDSNNMDDVSFTFTDAIFGTDYEYTFSSDGGGTNVTDSGQITSASQQISNIDLSGLGDGTITLNVTLSNDNGQGPVASDTSTKSLAVPSGYNVSIDQSVVNFANQSAVSFTLSNAEIGSTYNYTFSSDGGGANVTGSGSITTVNDQISGIDLSGLGDGIITLSVTLSNGNGPGAVANDTADKDITVCSAGGSAPILDSTLSTVFCEIISVDLNDYVTNTNGPVGTELVWSRNPSPESVDDHINNNIEDGSGVYYGFFYDSANDCYSPSLELELERNFTPVITETTTTEICGEGTATLTVTATVEDFSAITYSWFDTLDASAVPIASGTTFETGTLTETTSFYVSAASNECSSERTEVIVTVNNAPLAGAPIDGLAACNISSDEGSTTFDLDEGLIGQDPGTWEVIGDPSNGDVIIGTDNAVDFAGLISGDYVFEYTTNTLGNCTETSTSQITITVQDCISNETIDLAISKDVNGSGSYLFGDEVEFIITVENVDANTVTDIVITDILDENFEFIDAVATLGSYDSDSGQWTIPLLQATDAEAALTIRTRPTVAGEISNTASLVSSVPADDVAENNSATVTVTVNRNQCEDPGTICNIFSPNNDGANDTLTLVGDSQFPNNTFEVFDRYGNSVFQMDGYDSSWDGTGKNGDLPKGTYFYILDLDTTDGTDDDVVKGWIQIVRDN